MLLLGPIVFVGIVGSHHATVEHQLGPSLEKAGISELAIPDDERAAIVKHTTASKKIVKSLHVGGVVAGQLNGAGSSRTFRVVIYDGDGNLTSDLESPIASAGLTKDNITMFETNVSDIAASATPAPSHGSKRAAAHADDDAPPGMGGTSPTVATADADSDDTSTAPAVVEHTAPTGHERAVHIRFGLLLGGVGRSFATDPNTVQTYSSTPVPTGGFEGDVAVGNRVHIAGSFEHTLVMHTPIGSDNVSTNIGRAQAYASYDVVHGGVTVAPVLGFGERYFAIDTDSTMRSPDFVYQYVIAGATVAKPLGTRWTLRGLAAYEPVVGGLTPHMLPDPGRWGFDLGAALEFRATAHLFARAAFDYQSFASSWVSHGGATDAYPTGTASAGASF
jgi:hypothetical protein